MEEIWKDVVGYEQYFTVSNLGRVWSKRTNRILKTFVHKTGYHVFCTRFGGRGSKAVLFRVHRLVAEAFIANPNNKPFVNHMDGLKTNNCSLNLEWVTESENSRHAHDTGLINVPKGVDSPLAKLNKDQVAEIFKLYATGKHTHRSLGKMFNMAHPNIGDILRGKTYLNAN